MANRGKSVNINAKLQMLSYKSLLPGISAAIIILAVLATALVSLSLFAFKTNDIQISFDGYLLHVIWVTFWQAALSTCLSVILGLILAKALILVNFSGKSLLIKMMPVTFILPSLIVVTGLLSIYGQHGFIAKIYQLIDAPFNLSIYGLTGILLAHLFLNFPYASSLFYQTLISIPIEQQKLAAQLNFSGLTFFRLVEWPQLKRQIMPIAALIFMLCFTSFAIVLALGGGPKYTTLEVAIYQAIRDFELQQAVMLSILQLAFCAGFSYFARKMNNEKRHTARLTRDSALLITPSYLNAIGYLIILLASFFIFAPIAAIIIEGIKAFKFSLINAAFLLAFFHSLVIAVGSATLSLLLAMQLLWSNSRLLLHQHIYSSNKLMLIGNLILVIPSMVLASGLYLWLFEYASCPLFIIVIIIISNSLMALPFVLKNLEMPMYDMAARYEKISQILNITGFHHFYFIEFKALKKRLLMSFAFAAILSLGDFSIIALFGGQAVQTLPYYLYEQISHYHYQDGAATSLILLLLSLGLLLVIDSNRLAKSEMKP